MNGSNYSFTYDTKGNVTNDGLGGIIMGNYNHSNLPLTTNNMRYVYNDYGERIKKENTDSLTTEYYLRDYLGRELAIYDYETNKPKGVNIFGNGLVGKIELTDSTDNRYYYLKDHLGNIRCALNTANPGTSMHEAGFAFDFNTYKLTKEQYDFIIKLSKINGFKRVNNERWHLEADPKESGYKDKYEAIKENQADYQHALHEWAKQMLISPHRYKNK